MLSALKESIQKVKTTGKHMDFIESLEENINDMNLSGVNVNET